MQKILVIRFSSFGDIIQSLPVARALKQAHPQAQIDWCVRTDYLHLLTTHPDLNRVWSISRTSSLYEFFYFFLHLRRLKYDLIYDAHNNLRSNILITLFRLFFILDIFKGPKVIQRPKSRLRRLLFFKLRLPTLPVPFIGSRSFIDPLKPIGVKSDLPAGPHLHLEEEELPTLPDKYIALVPSAAWENKRWPVSHWKQLIQRLPDYPLVVLGGPQDHFCEEFVKVAPNRIINMAGKTSFTQSSLIVQKSSLTISADTGLLHVADQTNTKCIALIGPTAFGYPAHSNSQVLETKLSCKPCSKDGRHRCTNKIFQKCMVDISPQQVADAAALSLGIS